VARRLLAGWHVALLSPAVYGNRLASLSAALCRHYVFLPTTTIIQFARVVDERGRQWNRLKTAINQPDLA
jgi:hypothetical protein